MSNIQLSYKMYNFLKYYSKGKVMNKFDKIRAACKPVRITAGLALIITGVITGNAWFYLGVAPLIAGLVNFCPLCSVSGKCSV